MATAAVDVIADIRLSERNRARRVTVFLIRRFEKRCFFVAAMAAMVAANLHLTPCRGFAGEKTKTQSPRNSVKVKTTLKNERPPFDLTYVPADANGVIAIRPSAIFADPAMRPLARQADQALTWWLKSYNFPDDRKLPIEEIEQLIGCIPTIPGGKSASEAGMGGATLVMIRAAHDFDWRKIVRQIDPKVEEIHEKGLVYYRCPLTKGAFAKTPQAHFHCIIPDKRTLVIPPPGMIGTMKGGQIGKRPHFAWDEDWKRVEHGLIAVALLTGGRERSAPRTMPDLSPSDMMAAFGLNAATIVGEVKWSHGIAFQAFLSCKDRAAAKRTKDALCGLLAMQRFAIMSSPVTVGPAGSPSGQQEIIPASAQEDLGAYLQFYKDLAEHLRITRCENKVYARTKAKIPITDFAKLISMSASPSQKPAGTEYNQPKSLEEK